MSSENVGVEDDDLKTTGNPVVADDEGDNDNEQPEKGSAPELQPYSEYTQKHLGCKPGIPSLPQFVKQSPYLSPFLMEAEAYTEYDKAGRMINLAFLMFVIIPFSVIVSRATFPPIAPGAPPDQCGELFEWEIGGCSFAKIVVMKLTMECFNLVLGGKSYRYVSNCKATKKLTADFTEGGGGGIHWTGKFHIWFTGCLPVPPFATTVALCVYRNSTDERASADKDKMLMCYRAGFLCQGVVTCIWVIRCISDPMDPIGDGMSGSFVMDGSDFALAWATVLAQDMFIYNPLASIFGRLSGFSSLFYVWLNE